MPRVQISLSVALWARTIFIYLQPDQWQRALCTVKAQHGFYCDLDHWLEVLNNFIFEFDLCIAQGPRMSLHLQSHPPPPLLDKFSTSLSPCLPHDGMGPLSPASACSWVCRGWRSGIFTLVGLGGDHSSPDGRGLGHSTGVSPSPWAM